MNNSARHNLYRIMRFSSFLVIVVCLAKSREISSLTWNLPILHRSKTTRGYNGNNIVIKLSSSPSSKPNIGTNDKETFGFWKQSINFPALRKLLKVFVNPTILQPTFEVNSLAELNFEDLKNQWNIAAIVYGSFIN